MFSFGYKNLYEPKTIEPGPGFYEIKEFIQPRSPQLSKQTQQTKSLRSITNNDSSFEHKLKNHHNCYQEYFPTVNQVPQKKQCYFSTSKRSDLLILPQISKGPQYYNINEKKQEHTVSLGSYSGRKPLFDIGDRLSQSQKHNKSNEIRKEKIVIHKINWAERRFREKEQNFNSNFPFREYSYLPKEEKQGPGLIDYPQQQLKGNTFNKSPRFHRSHKYHEDHNEQEGETGDSLQAEKSRQKKLKSYFKELVEEKKRLERIRFRSPPKYQFPQNDTSKTSLYKRQQQVDKSLEPGPGYYKV